MNEFSKKTLLLALQVIGTVLFSILTYNINSISKNIDKLNTNVEGLSRISATQDIRLKYLEVQIDKQGMELKEIQKQVFESQIKWK